MRDHSKQKQISTVKLLTLIWFENIGRLKTLIVKAFLNILSKCSLSDTVYSGAVLGTILNSAMVYSYI